MQKPIFTSLKNVGKPSITKFLKGFYLVMSSFIISMIHLPLSFAKQSLSNHLKTPAPAVVAGPQPAPLPGISQRFFSAISAKSVYDSLRLDLSGLSRQAFDYAQKGWEKLIRQGKLLNQSVMAIVDFSQPSSNKRLYILDMQNYKVLFNTLVAHGRNSGKEWASSFSNKASSFKSSPGFYVTGDTYNGENGYSLKLEGVEKGINDHAMNRAIVIHGADYVNQSYVDAQGYIGRSLGCPAVPREEAPEIIDAIKNGVCLFIYVPGGKYISHSSFLN